MNVKLKKKYLFLIIWLGSLVFALVVANVGNSLFPAGSAGYTVFGVFTLIFVISFIVFLIKWKKVCPICKEGNMTFIGSEEGDTFSGSRNVTKSDKVKDNQGNLIATIERKEKESFEATPEYKFYKCDQCGHTVKKLGKIKTH